MYQCKCGRVFNSKPSLIAHYGHCKIHLGRDPIDRFKDSRAWSKGKTKDDPVYGESLSKIGKKTSERLKDSENPLVTWNKNKQKESCIRQSNIRKERYALGILTPVAGVGRGKYSYIESKYGKLMLRSTYEFIVALYYLYNNIKFEYESVKVTYNNHTFISDFLVDNTIIEVKGNYNANVKQKREAFELSGYTYKVLFWKDIEPYYQYLKNIIDIDNILDKIKLGHNTKNYYIHKFNFS